MAQLEDDGRITHNGRDIGTHAFVDGKHRVTVSFEYEVDKDLWFQPLVQLTMELDKLDPPPACGPVALTLNLVEEDLEELPGVTISLNEKTVVHRGYIWRFHKSDSDKWPSDLHAHDYDKGLKLDGYTGEVWDVGTRNHIGSLNKKALAVVHQELRSSKDFKDKLNATVPPKNSGT